MIQKTLISNDTSSSHPTQTTRNQKIRKCKECKHRRKFDEIHQICHVCLGAKTVDQSGNKVIDDFIRYTLTNRGNNSMKMEFVPYDRFEDVEFIAEGGFSKIYKATWVDGPIFNWNKKQKKYMPYGEMVVALKELSNSKNINPKDLNEV